jgi:hypothetical protein
MLFPFYSDVHFVGANKIDFHLEDRELRGIEQNSNTKSRWAKLARDGKQVMQFLEGGKYIAVVVDEKFTSISS